jgi:hypothetical protein
MGTVNEDKLHLLSTTYYLCLFVEAYYIHHPIYLSIYIPPPTYHLRPTTYLCVFVEAHYVHHPIFYTGALPVAVRVVADLRAIESAVLRVARVVRAWGMEDGGGRLEGGGWRRGWREEMDRGQKGRKPSIKLLSCSRT